MEEEDGENKSVDRGEDAVEKPVKISFKKPTILIGKIGRLPRKVTRIVEEQETPHVSKLEPESEYPDVIVEERLSSEPVQHDKVLLPYSEPEWSGMPRSAGRPYLFEVLKSGSIIDMIDLMEKPSWVFGRLANCDITMAHPTVSRYHAVLQYRNEGTSEEPEGFYLYDLNSTHGTFFNKIRIKPRTYVRIQVGHMIRIGCSSRTYILCGPNEDSERPSELSVTELKRLRAEELLRREQEKREIETKLKEMEAARLKKEEQSGIDWGMGEDADEETDIAENPFAQTNNEELYLDDPKKALRGFMEREGFDLEYDCTEQGMGQFLCRVPLPVDDDRGKQVVAEVLHKGKKKEAVVQCALEACRILDRHGLLRQATHESKKRKTRNWEENDFYDSDDDTFLDRTGTVEKKRENRMKNKLPQQPETYQSLVKKEQDLIAQITDIERKLYASRTGSSSKLSEGEDSLDSYMKNLQQSKPDKEKITQLKTELHKLKAEHGNILKLVNIVRPADLPSLAREDGADESKGCASLSKRLPMFGKRLKVKVQIPSRVEDVGEDDSDDEDSEAAEVTPKKKSKPEKIEITEVTTKIKYDVLSETTENKSKTIVVSETENKAVAKEIQASGDKVTETATSDTLENSEGESKKSIADDVNLKEKNIRRQEKNKKYEAEFDKVVTPLPIELREGLINIWKLPDCVEAKNSLVKQLDLMVGHCDPKLLIQMKKLIQNYSANEQLLFHKSLIEIAKDVLDEVSEKPLQEEDLEKKRKRNQRRIHQREHKIETERLKGYEEDALKSDYNMWVPPEGQTGDGRTCLNEKFGY